MKVTIKDIAQMAGVSISTVSRVVNNSKPVNDDVRQRVLEAIRQTNYRSTGPLEELERSESNRIGIIMQTYSNTVLHDFIIGINKVCQLYELETLIGFTDWKEESELDYLKQFSEIHAKGIIFAGSPLEKHMRFLEEAGIPCVAVGQVSPFPSIPSVHLDNVTAAYEAVTYLIQRGHRKIGMIRGTGDETAVGGERYRGYEQALADADIPLQEEWVAESGISIEDGEAAMRRIAGSGTMPTAVFCATDQMAIGAMNYLLDNGFRIPEEVAVFGFDGSTMSSIVRPKLTTVVYSAVEIGMTAARNLIKMIKGGTVSPHHSNVHHYLEIRGSTN